MKYCVFCKLSCEVAVCGSCAAVIERGHQRGAISAPPKCTVQAPALLPKAPSAQGRKPRAAFDPAVFEAFLDRIDALMERLGVSQCELAVKMGIQKSCLSNILNGRQRLTPHYLQSLEAFEHKATDFPDTTETSTSNK